MERIQQWQHWEQIAESMIPIIGKLYRQRSIVTVVYDQRLVHTSSIEIIKAFRLVERNFNVQLDIEDAYHILLALEESSYSNMIRFDVGKASLLLREFPSEKYKEKLLESLHESIPKVVKSKATDVVLYGFGRIGRLLTRALIDRVGNTRKLLLRAVVVRKPAKPDLYKRASLLEMDSVHGHFEGEITVDEAENQIIANGVPIRFLYSDGPGTLDFTKYGINGAILIDNTGKWRDRAGLGKHLESPGISKVVLTAPGRGDIPNIVNGVNNDMCEKDETIVSAASCTTNAIVPVLSLIEKKFGIVSGHVETVHSFTNDQNLIDNYHPSARRGRSAALNMVITETGAGAAIGKCIPSLHGKLSANAIRVPTPNVSLAILSLTVPVVTTVEEVNSFLQTSAASGHLHQQCKSDSEF